MTNAERMVRYESIFYTGPSFADPADLPSLTELQKLLKDSTVFKSAKIIVNDPFCNRLLIAPDDCPQENVSIDYDQLRSEPAVVATPQSELEVADEEVGIDPHPVAPTEESQCKQPRKSRESFPKFVSPSLETRLSEIAEMQGEIQQEISLIVAPCRNGILEKSAIVVDESGKKCSVEKIFFNASRMKAMAQIVSNIPFTCNVQCSSGS